MFPCDLLGLFKKTTASLISVKNPFEDYYVVSLKPAPRVTWTPGDHAIFRLPQRKIKGRAWRAFSVASVPEERIIILGMRTGTKISSFKQALLTLSPGDPVLMNGPFGWFNLKDETSPVVFFAAGVGITPIRALLVQLEKNKKREIAIIYAADRSYLFEDEINKWVAHNPMMTLYMTRTPDQTQQQLVDLTNRYKNKAYYYLSGAPPVIRSVQRLLRKQKVFKSRIIHDPFKGY